MHSLPTEPAIIEFSYCPFGILLVLTEGESRSGLAIKFRNL